tara:strand:- start:230 stop:682 length:453 start_codon:yes stop_codon:yes gene_type:complete
MELSLTNKLPLNTVLAAIDKKDYGFYDTLTPEHQKQLAPFLLNRYVSLVKGSSELQAYYLMAGNQRVNCTYFELARHPKLVWQLLCTVSPGMGTQFHQWVGHKKKDKNTKDKNRKYIEQLHPTAKRDELNMLVNMYTDKDIKELQRLHGE